MRHSSQTAGNEPPDPQNGIKIIMRIHTNLLDSANIYAARMFATDHSQSGVVYVERASEHGSRSHRRAFDVILSGDGSVSRRRRNAGTSRDRTALDDYAATWDAWGFFLAHLFAADPSTSCPYYGDAADFHEKTGGRFTDFDGTTYTARTTPREGTTSR